MRKLCLLMAALLLVSGCDPQKPPKPKTRSVSYFNGTFTRVELTEGRDRCRMSYRTGLEFKAQMMSYGGVAVADYGLQAEIMVVDLLAATYDPSYVVNVWGLKPKTDCGWGQVPGPMGRTDDGWKPTWPGQAHLWTRDSDETGSYTFSVLVEAPTPTPPAWKTWSPTAAHYPLVDVKNPRTAWDVVIVIRVRDRDLNYVYQAWRWTLDHQDLPPYWAATTRPYFLSNYARVTDYPVGGGGLTADQQWDAWKAKENVQPPPTNGPSRAPLSGTRAAAAAVPGSCGCVFADADQDGYYDFDSACAASAAWDYCPSDQGKTEPGVCGCGSVDSDDNYNAIADCLEQCPGNSFGGGRLLGDQGACPSWGDDDGDGDVDGADFAALQRCFSTVAPGATLIPGCARWDLGNDGFVSEAEVAAFEACASGPGVPATQCVDGAP